MKFINIMTDTEVTEKELLYSYKIRIVHETVKENPTFDEAIANSIIISASLNNGGKTNYYDIPSKVQNPRDYISNLLHEYITNNNIPSDIIIDKILEIVPDTINDLIEYKNMHPFQHEIFKACYALKERADRSIKGGCIERELNKIIYYANRGLALAKSGKI